MLKRFALCLLLCACSAAGADEAESTEVTRVGGVAPRHLAEGPSWFRDDSKAAEVDALSWLPAGFQHAANRLPTSPPPVVESDLELIVAPRGLALVDGETPELGVLLFNRSESRSHVVVLSGDGSELGWREPELRITVEVRRGDRWANARTVPVARCGNYAEDWSQDIRVLAPGESVELPWVRFPHVDLSGAEAIRSTAHYRYGAHTLAPGFWGRRIPTPSAAANMAPFALHSKPVTQSVEAPMRLVVRAADLRRLADERPLKDALEIDLVSEDRAATMSQPASLELEVVSRNVAALDRDDATTQEWFSLREWFPGGGLVPPRTALTDGVSGVARPDGQLDLSRLLRARAVLHMKLGDDDDPRYRVLSSAWFDARGRAVQAE